MKKLVYAAALAVLFGCAKEEKQKGFEINLDLTGEIVQVNSQTVIQDETNSNNYYSKVDSLSKYGFGYKIVLPDSLKEQNLKIVISAEVKETESITGEFIISINEPNMSNIYWGNRVVSGQLKDLNTWRSFKDSITINSTQNPKKNSSLYIFNSKFSGGGAFCVDNFKVKILKQ